MQVIQIDTNQYAGNFEREMCAYITGQYGDCGVGDMIASGARKSIKNLSWFEHHVRQRHDEFGCFRPCLILPTFGWFNNGIGKAYSLDDPNVHQKALEEAAVSYREYFIGVGEPKTDTQIQQYRDTWSPFPSYQTVGILIDDFHVPHEVMAEVKARANAFCKFRGIELLEVHPPAPMNTQYN